MMTSQTFSKSAGKKRVKKPKSAFHMKLGERIVQSLREARGEPAKKGKKRDSVVWSRV